MQQSPRKFWEVWGRSDALYNRWAAAHGVNNYRLFVLYVLDNHPGATQKAIADHAGLPKQTVNTVVRALRDEGYVTLSPASGDRREKNASLTPAGQTYARALLCASRYKFPRTGRLWFYTYLRSCRKDTTLFAIRLLIAGKKTLSRQKKEPLFSRCASSPVAATASPQLSVLRQ